MTNEGLVTPNGVKAGDEVIFAGLSRSTPRQNSLATKELKKDRTYTCVFVFPGEPMQIELQGLEPLFVYDLFKKVRKIKR